MTPTKPTEQTCTNCQTCGSCAEWTRHDDARMAEHGLCSFRSTGHYSHQTTACLLTPARWRAQK